MKLTSFRRHRPATARPVNRIRVHLKLLGFRSCRRSALVCDNQTVAKELVSLFLHDALIVANQKDGAEASGQ